MRAIRAVSGVLALAVLAGVHAGALAEPFTYQGELKSAGALANGLFDFEFRVFDALSGGTQVGSTTARSGVNVTGGVFTTDIDPGTGVFVPTAPDRWVQISVRPAGSGSFTILSPRQKLTAAPFAVRALNEWLSPVGTDRLTNDATRTKLFLNRTSPLTTAEYFGFTTPTASGQFGGMYVNTAPADGFPFYGYSTGGQLRGWTYVNGLDGSWRLSLTGVDRMMVDSSGKVGIATAPAEALDVNGNARANAFRYSAPKVRHYTLAPCDFAPRTPNVITQVESSTGGTFYDASVGQGNFIASLHLPDGARITNVTLWLIDSSTADISAYLLSRPFAANGYSGFTQIGTTTGSSTSAQAISLDTNTVIDNINSVYTLSVFCSDWDGVNTQIKGGRITYTVTETD